MRRKSRSAVKCWQQLYIKSVSEADIEDKYFRLLEMAEDMEISGLISGAEWRRFVRRAGELFITATDDEVGVS
ncbi:hypothetical protein EUX57_06405 [Pseudomonas orientalis]|jgi:hypothetical protein|uniref:Uncharacterized protein n=1 Tax=Pseudomonas orientalis TaxID=76758 RepID=A0A4Q7D150_9PSED|nr:hypothetical protein EUX57_06405 [Pseudomonas orientalis]